MPCSETGDRETRGNAEGTASGQFHEERDKVKK